MALNPADAAEMYRAGMSACEIAEQARLTRAGAENAVRKGGLNGLQWCRIHRALEEV